MVLAAGVAQAEVTFSGKAEAGVSRTSKVAAVTAAPGYEKLYEHTAAGALAVTSATASNTTAATAAEIAVKLATLNAAKAALVVAETAKANGSDISQNTVGTHAAVSSFDGGATDLGSYADYIAAAKAAVAIAQANYDQWLGTAAVTAKGAGDMVAYSGYDMEVAVSSTLDNGMVVSAGFDMGAGSIADRDDDRVLDAQAAAVALSAVTIKNGGVTYVIGQNKIDDVYDDTQNGDVSVSGAMGGISYTLVADLDKDTAAVAGSTVYTAAVAATGVSDATDATYKAATLVVTEATAAVYESTSMKLSGAAGGVDWTFTTTNKNARGNAASKLSLGYAAGDALSFTLTHDTQGKREAINTLKASYTMDAITLTASMADDKNHAGNTNTSSKASQNLTIAYANGPLTASFNNDESSQWWATTAYDLGGGADIFATVDSTEFAVVGLSFNF